MGKRKIRATGQPLKEIDSGTLAFIFWTVAKREVAAKREREAARAREDRRHGE